MARCRLLVLALVLSTAAFAQPAGEPRMDRSVVSVRRFDDSALTALSKEKAFRYDAPAPQVDGLVARLVERLMDGLDRLLQRPGFDAGLRFLKWAIPISLILFGLMHFAGMDRMLPWHREDRTLPRYDLHPEDVHALDFASEIASAVGGGRFRDATRLQYLFALRRLSEAGRIRWSVDKTNRDYAEELRGTPLATPFREVTRLFEYAWYGEMPVTEADYGGISQQFTGFQQRIGL